MLGGSSALLLGSDTMHTFTVYPKTHDWHSVTVNKIVQTESHSFTYEQLMHIIRHAVRTERSTFGWKVFYTHDNQNYELFLRSRNMKYINTTTRKGQSIYEWIDMITEQTEQLSLF